MTITSTPYIYSRSQWNASPIDTSNLVLYTSQKKYIVIHHSAGLSQNGEMNDGRVMRAIQAGHLRDEFGDIGYNYGIGYYGSIMEGRSLSYVGAHCNTNKKNYDSIGVCVFGNFENFDQTLSNEAYDSLISLLIFLCKKYNISPDNITGHKDWGSTACPGKKLYSKLSSIKNEVKKHIPNTDTEVKPSINEYEIERFNEYGTCYPQTTINIRSTPNAENSSNIVGEYYQGESVIYDLIVYTNKYVYVSWLSSSSGARRYMAIRDIVTGESWASTSNSSQIPSNSEFEIKRYSESGTCYPQTTINIRSTPNAENSSNIVGQYYQGESVIYDLVVQTNKYVYVSWTSASSGARRYMAVRDVITGERWATCV